MAKYGKLVSFKNRIFTTNKIKHVETQIQQKLKLIFMCIIRVENNF